MIIRGIPYHSPFLICLSPFRGLGGPIPRGQGGFSSQGVLGAFFVGDGAIHTQRSPETNLKASENGGYLSRTLSSSMSQNYVLAVNTRMCSALPTTTLQVASGAPIKRVGSNAIYTKRAQVNLDSLKMAATYSPTTRSTIGDAELNDPVRNGKGWDLSAITT